MSVSLRKPCADCGMPLPPHRVFLAVRDPDRPWHEGRWLMRWGRHSYPVAPPAEPWVAATPADLLAAGMVVTS